MTEGQFTYCDARRRGFGQRAWPAARSQQLQVPATAEATVGLIDILAGHEVKFTQADAGKTFTYAVAEE
ncbi:MAG: hypothetical protein ACLS3Y_04405 [Collinsella sp.]